MPDQISLTYSDLQEMLAEKMLAKLQQDTEQQETNTHYRAEGCEITWELHKPFGTGSCINPLVHGLIAQPILGMTLICQ